MRKRGSAARIVLLGWGLAAAVTALPLWLVEPEGAQLPAPALTAREEVSPTAAAGRDRGRRVKLLTGEGTVTEVTMEDYLWSVVAAEMPASFEPEALKAQACAARTYTVRAQNGGGRHEGADVCTDSTCCQAWIDPAAARLKWGLSAAENEARIAAAVAGTDGMGILYQGEPIQAVFFSSSPGMTSDALAVWGNSVDYLKSVDSPEGEEVPNYRTTVTLRADEVKEKLLPLCPGADLTGEPSGWLTDIVTGESGAVASLRVGGVELTGNALRGALGLRSPAFTVAQEGDTFTFSVTGYGHGVGMSQYGANEMARQGADCRAILEWYYTGAEMGELW